MLLCRATYWDGTFYWEDTFWEGLVSKGKFWEGTFLGGVKGSLKTDLYSMGCKSEIGTSSRSASAGQGDLAAPEGGMASRVLASRLAAAPSFPPGPEWSGPPSLPPLALSLSPATSFPWWRPLNFFSSLIGVLLPMAGLSTEDPQENGKSVHAFCMRLYERRLN